MKGAGHGHPRYRTNISSGGVRCCFYQRTIQDIIPVHNSHVVDTNNYNNGNCGEDISSFEYRPSQIGCRSGGNWTYG